MEVISAKQPIASVIRTADTNTGCNNDGCTINVKK